MTEHMYVVAHYRLGTAADRNMLDAITNRHTAARRYQARHHYYTHTHMMSDELYVITGDTQRLPCCVAHTT